MNRRQARKIAYSSDYYYGTWINPNNPSQYVVTPYKGKHNYLLMKAFTKLHSKRLYDEMWEGITNKLKEFGIYGNN